MERQLSALIQSGKITGHTISYDHVDRAYASRALAPYLEQAHALGRGYAQQQLARIERGIIGTFKDSAQWAVDQARNLIDRALTWAQDLFASKVESLGDDANAEDIEGALEDTAATVADTLALTEAQTVVEQAVMTALTDAGVAMVEAVNEPDACALCVENAGAGPIPLGSAFPSGDTSAPFHNRCRCHVEAVTP